MQGANVVEADDRDVVGHVQAFAVDGVDGTERHLVVGGKDGGRRLGQGQQLLGGGITTFLHEMACGHQRGIDRDAGIAQSLDVGGLALRAMARVVRAGDEGDAPMPE